MSTFLRVRYNLGTSGWTFFGRIKGRSCFTCLLLCVFAFLYASDARICSTNLPLLLPVPRTDLPLLYPPPDTNSGSRTGFMMAPLHTSSLEEVMVARPMPKVLSGALDRAWTFLAEQGRLLLNRPSEGDPIGASADSGDVLLAYLADLVSREAKGTKGISLLGLEESRRVAHAHSTFWVSTGDYAEPGLWGVFVSQMRGRPPTLGLHHTTWWQATFSLAS